MKYPYRGTLKTFYRTFHAFAFLLFSCSVLAKGKPLLSEEDFLGHFPVVISPSRLEQPLKDAPIAITVIDREMIEASGADTVADVLRLVPGMVVSFDLAHTAVVSYHGLSNTYARRMQVLVDGRSIYQQSFGGVSWLHQPLVLNDIEKIEVIRGPNASSYGANSFLGVISITTRVQEFEPGAYYRLSHGARKQSGLARYVHVDDHLSHRTSFEYTHDDGFDGEADDIDIVQVTSRTIFNINNNDSLDLQLGYNHFTSQRTIGRDAVVFDTPTYNSFESIKWMRAPRQNHEYYIQLYHNKNRVRDHYKTETQSRNNEVISERYDIEFQHTYITQKTKWLWGLGVRRDEIEGRQTFSSDERMKIELYRGFFNIEHRLNTKLLLHAGAMYENHSLVGAAWSPRVALNYQISSNHTLRLSASRAYRNPVLFEEKTLNYTYDQNGEPAFLTFDSQGGLEPESITSYEIGYLARFLEGSVIFDVKIFHDETKDLIRSFLSRRTPSGFPLDFRNRDHATLRGVEAQINWRVSQALRLFASHAYIEIASENLDGDYSKTAPKNMTTAQMIYRFRRDWRMGLNYFHREEVDYLESFVPEVESYDRVDLKLSYKFRWADYRGDVAVVGQSIFGAYDEYRAGQPYDRRYRIELGMQF